MNASTVRNKPIECPHCKRIQIIQLLVVPYKPAILIGKQTVRCVECDQVFDLLDEPKMLTAHSPCNHLAGQKPGTPEAEIESVSEEAIMANDVYKKAFDGLLETYVSLGDSADTTVRFLKKTDNVETRSKLIAELRSLDKKRLEILDQLDGLAKPT